MSVIKSIIGGLIGAAIAVFISTFLNEEAATRFSWFPIIIGFLTGLGAMIVGGKNFGVNSIISGAAAAAIALIAIMTGSDAALLFSQATTDFGPTLTQDQIDKRVVAAEKSQVNAPPISASEDEENDKDGDEDVTSTDPPDDSLTSESADTDGDEDGEPNATRDPDGDRVSDSEDSRMSPVAERTQNPIDTQKEPFDFPRFIYSALGVLIAYQMGRGFGSPKRTEQVRTEHDTKEVNA